MRLKAGAETALGAVAVLLVGAGAGFVFSGNLAFLTSMAVTMILVMSLWLLTGLSGIYTLGQAAFFGLGAYAGGLTAIHWSSSPSVGLLVAGAAGFILGLTTGSLVVRLSGMRQILATILVAAICGEIANNLPELTGGSNGLSGIAMSDLGGVLKFDLYYRVAYGYALAVLAAMFLIVRSIRLSEYGRSLAAIGKNPIRMRANGVMVFKRLRLIYAVSAAIAAIAGALSAQTNEFVSLQAFSFELSAMALTMLVIGGINRLAGVFVGVAVFMGLEHLVSGYAPRDYLFAVGLLLIVAVLLKGRGPFRRRNRCS